MTIKRIISKFGMLLSDHQKIRIVELTILMVLGGILETLSVIMIYGFMDAVMSPETIMKKSYVKWICGLLNIVSVRSFLVIVAAALAIIFLLKNIYLLAEYNIQYRFVYGNMLAMQERVMGAFLSRPYEYFLNISSSDVFRIITLDIPTTFNLLYTLLSLFTELVVSAMVIVTVFVIAPEITMIVAIFLVILVAVITKSIKPILRRAGEETQKAGSGMNKWLLQSIQGIKELKVSNKEKFFATNFDVYGKKYVKSLRINAIVASIPRFLIEALCMSVVFVVVAIVIYHGSDLQAMIPFLSAIAVAAMRLLPSANRISHALAQISYGEPMVDEVLGSLQDISGKKDVNSTKTIEEMKAFYSKKIAPKLKNTLEFENVSYRYPDSEDMVLEEASMSIKRGQSVGIVGTTGAGKTTSVDILLGLLTPQRGKILVDGFDISEDMTGWLQQVGYIPQEIFMLDDSIRNNVAFGEESISDAEVWRALKEAALDDFVLSLPEGLDTQIGERGVRLSGGQKQRLGIARALYHNPDILFFDEATSALDTETETAIMESVNRLRGEKTMITIAHRLTTIENCDVVFRVENKKIVRER